MKCEESQARWPASLRAQFGRTFGPRWRDAEDVLGVKGASAAEEFEGMLKRVGINA